MKRNGLWMTGLMILVVSLTLTSCNSNKFVGTWKPDSSNDNDVMRIDSLTFTKDGTFTIKFKDTSRKEGTGTYTKTGDTLELKGPDSKDKVEANIESDGRLSIKDGNRKPAYFVKS